jgi:hypothetical protein
MGITNHDNNPRNPSPAAASNAGPAVAAWPVVRQLLGLAVTHEWRHIDQAGRAGLGDQGQHAARTHRVQMTAVCGAVVAVSDLGVRRSELVDAVIRVVSQAPARPIIRGHSDISAGRASKAAWTARRVDELVDHIRPLRHSPVGGETFDPDRTLEQIRRLLDTAARAETSWNRSDDDACHDLVEPVRGLDQSLRAGGTLPRAWAHATYPT